MGVTLGVLEGSEERFKKYEHLFRMQDVLSAQQKLISQEHGHEFRVKEGDEYDLSLLVLGTLAKSLKTFQAVGRLCLLGFGQDAFLLLRSNVNAFINLVYILSREKPVDSAKDFLAYSYKERVKYLKIADGIEKPPWRTLMPPKEVERRARAWGMVKISDRANAIPRFHYDKFYRFYSSFEHADAFALNDYFDVKDENRLTLISGPSDAHVGIALTHNYMVMTDLLMEVICKYFGVHRPDIYANLSETLDKAVEETEYNN